jgi:hypothetical protein
VGRGRSTSEAARVALALFAPVLLGAATGVVAAVVVAPPSAPPEFFLVTAQVLPIVLLALVLEARVFGTGPRRFPPAEKTARLIDAAACAPRFYSSSPFVAAEWKAIDALTERGAPLNDPALEYFTLAWGLRDGRGSRPDRNRTTAGEGSAERLGPRSLRRRGARDEQRVWGPRRAAQDDLPRSCRA